MPNRRLLHALVLALPLAACAAPAPDAAAQAGLQAYLALWSAAPEAADPAPFHPELVLRHAVSVPELHGELRGRTSALLQTRLLARLGQDWRFRDVHLFPTLKPGVYVAQYTASGRSAIDGRTVEQHVVLRLELDGPRVVRLVEFANPALALTAAAP